MTTRMFFSFLLLAVSVLSFVSSGWCVDPGSIDKVANQAYERNVQAIKEKLAETFPLMALIEVRIIELLLDGSADLGFFYKLVSNTPGRQGEIGLLKESDADLRVLSPDDPGLRMMGILGETAESQINAAIEVLASQGRVTIWAEPSILTLMGHVAAIESGDQVPYLRRVVVGNTETISSQYRPTGVSLWVQPDVVERNGTQFVQLHLSALVSTVTRFREEEGFEQPITDTRHYESVVQLLSGQYVVLGGIYRSVVSSTRRGVPGLMNVPLVGWVARGTSERSSQSELVILIRPQVVNLEKTPRVDLESMRSSPDEQRRFLREADTGGTGFLGLPGGMRGSVQR